MRSHSTRIREISGAVERAANFPVVSESRRRVTSQPDPGNAARMEDSHPELGPRPAMQSLLCRRLCLGPSPGGNRAGRGQAGEASGGHASSRRLPGLYPGKGDYDDGGQYCLGFGGASVDRRLGQELLQVISPLGVEASLKALEELSAGDAAQRAALSNKLEQLEYEAKKAFEQYDAVDARNRLVAGELERRWNEKLEEVGTTKQRLSCLDTQRHSLSSEEEGRSRS